jgi:hypothetical protein
MVAMLLAIAAVLRCVEERRLLVKDSRRG